MHNKQLSDIIYVPVDGNIFYKLWMWVVVIWFVVIVNSEAIHILKLFKAFIH